jgi:hypothetical protein
MFKFALVMYAVLLAVGWVCHDQLTIGSKVIIIFGTLYLGFLIGERT